MVQLPEIERLGPPLPLGWQRPNSGLVRGYLGSLDEGLAPPSAPHLYQRAEVITEDEARRNQDVSQGIARLRAYVDPNSSSLLKAVGMAYPQLARASRVSVRVVAVNIGMPELQAESRQPGGELFFNPVLTPIESEGYEDQAEFCFSALGIGMEVKRWRAVWVQLPDRSRFRMDGNDAWILQHEVDHLDGVICVMRALDAGKRLYYVPPALKRTFWELEDRDLWPHVFPVEQWEAMRSGEFDLVRYARYLR
jgi:peptide deformylase